MTIKAIIPQLRTVDFAASVSFYTEKLGFSVEFNGAELPSACGVFMRRPLIRS